MVITNHHLFKLCLISNQSNLPIIIKKSIIPMNILRKALALALILCMSNALFAQAADQATSEDFMNSNGKIYVVVAVIVVIVIALFAFLLYLDRKIAKMEKEHNQH